MSINYWRYKCGTDDGCAIYQCLMCYADWEGRSAPGWLDYDTGEYHAQWKFCPCCGTQWIGCRFVSTEGRSNTSDNLGPRRQRIENAMERRRMGYDRPQPPYWLVVERAERGGFIKDHDELTWEPQVKMSGWIGSAQRMLKIARDDVERREAEYNMNVEPYDEETQKWFHREFFARVILVRDMKAYSRSKGRDYLHEIYRRDS